MKSEFMHHLNMEIVNYLYVAQGQQASIDSILPNVNLSSFDHPRNSLNLILCRMVHENLIYRIGPGIYKYRSTQRVGVARPLSDNFNKSF